MKRSIAALIVVILGAIAASQLPLSDSPEQSRPQVVVDLSLPAGTVGDPERLSRDWVVPIEVLARSLGNVRTITAEVDSDDAQVVVTFEKGTDAEVKTARMLSDLASLRRRLPDDGRLDAYPAAFSGSRASAIVAYSGSDAARVERMLRDLPGVRDVVAYGTSRGETHYRFHDRGAHDVREIRGEVQREIGAPALGVVTARGRTVPLLAGGTKPAEARVRELLRDAEPVAVPQERRSFFRYRGRGGVAFAVFRETTAPLLPFDRTLRRAVDREGMEIIWSQADGLRRFLRRVAMGFVAAVFAAGMFVAYVVWPRRGAGEAAGAPLRVVAIVVTSVAATLILFRAASVSLDLVTMTAAMLAIGGSLPMAMLFVLHGGSAKWQMAAVTALAIMALVVTVALAPAPVARFLSDASVAFALAASSSLFAALLLTTETPPAHRRVASHVVRPVLRNAATALLVTGTAAYVLLTLFGKALDPRSRGFERDGARLTLRVALPEGTPLDRTTAVVERVERILARSDEVERFWSMVSPGRARIVAELARRSRSPEQAERFRNELSARTADVAAAISLEGGRSTGGIEFDDATEERPETDDLSTTYKVVLKASSVEALDAAYASILTRLMAAQIARGAIRGPADLTSAQLELRPLPAAPRARIPEVAAALQARTIPPAPIRLGEDCFLILSGRDQPRGPRDVPQRAVLFREALVVGDGLPVDLPSLFRAREKRVRPTLQRQAGRFVTPITIGIPGMTDENRIAKRAEIDRSLALMPMPGGALLERPNLERWHFPREKVRLVALASALPVALFILAAIALNSFVHGLVAMIAAFAGIVAAAPAARFASSSIDEMMLFSTGAMLAMAMPVAIWLTAEQGPSLVSRFRITLHAATPILGGALVAAIAFAVPVIGASRLDDPWSRSLMVAAIVFPIATASGALLAPATLVAVSQLRRRMSADQRALRQPPVWSEPGPPALQVRSVTKDYGRFRALHNISFDLGPGIVGLVGPNGAGKTTLLRLMTGLLTPTRGTISYRGRAIGPGNLAAYRRHIGFLPQEFNAYPGFTAEQFLDYWAIERGITDGRARAEEIELLLDAVGLAEHARRRVRDFSGGMRQRIGIARALLGSPPLLIVDEPTTGLDIEARSRFRGLLLSIARKRIVILSTHIASDVEATASRILLLHRGRLRFDGKIEELIARARGRVFECVVSDAEAREISREHRVTTRVRILAGIRLRGVAAPDDELPGRAAEPTLEEAYLAEVDRADAAAGRVRARHFGFLRGTPSLELP